ncbi:33546_t:CDS:2 [Gigaspora margarita]|uniref:33546_t:CDS:1 n=1 Tax=Gigaspora margarita TaxID=4874 RepID=A0ABM8W0L8_GIGMA|nr:33546_t:CDS:2 [Gigaspora margarita]
MITDLFRLTYSEPTSVKIFRRSVIVLCVGLSIAIFIVLCIQIHDELPTVNIIYRTAKNLPTPNIYFNYGYNFTVNCAFTNTTGNYNCDNAISSTTYNTTKSQYVVSFVSNTAITSQVTYVLSINITDPSYNITNQTDYLEMYAYDKDYDLNIIPLSGNQVQFEESLIVKNMFFFGQPRNDIAHYEWTFDRCIRKALILDALSYFGRQKYLRMPYLDSHMSTVSTANSDLRTNNTSFAILRFITTPPFILTEETEESVLGIIGGIWSGVAAFYIFLFGPGLISPWGLVQSRLFKSHYKKDALPFVYEADSADDANTSIQKRLNNLEKRIEFYDRFIFDDPLLNFIKQESSQPTKSTT